MAQIQRHVARTGESVAGFVRFKKILQLTTRNCEGNIESLLEDRNGVIFVSALNMPLEHVPASSRFALDETSVMPDSPMLRGLSVNKNVPLSRGRSSMWTLLPLLSGDGRVLACLLILRCLPLPVDAAKFTFSNGLCVASTENAQQTEESWMNFARIWLPTLNTSFDNPGFVYVDGHTSHVMKEFIEQAADHALYVVVQPSHTSIVFQVADVGVNRFLKQHYEREYTSLMIACNVTKKCFDDVELIGCIVRTFNELRKRPNWITTCFMKAGLLSGYKEMSRHFPLSKFNLGIPLRDMRLPQVNDAYCHAVLSTCNLSARRGAPVVIPESVIGEQ